jgi:REP element-mobilizing transposase RayT
MKEIIPMSHSLTKIWIHAVFGTKEREGLIGSNFKKALYAHIMSHLVESFGCRVRIINGTGDHVHVLFLLDPNHALKDILQNIKGESSHWINQQNLLQGKFAWQTGYGAFSVSESVVKDVERYIKNQKNHHLKMTFKEEYERLMKKHGLMLSTETDKSVRAN